MPEAQRNAIEARVEHLLTEAHRLIYLLDDLDGDPDLEPDDFDEDDDPAGGNVEDEGEGANRTEATVRLYDARTREFVGLWSPEANYVQW